MRLQASVRFDRQNSDCYRKLEAARAAGAWVEVEDAFLRDEIRDVGMAMEDGCEFGGGGVEVEALEVVQHVDVEAGVGRVFDEDDVGFGQPGAWAFAVDVAANGRYRRNLLQSLKDRRSAHVAEMEDAVDALEGGRDFGTEEAVGVGDDSEFHVFRIRCAGGGRLREDAHSN